MQRLQITTVPAQDISNPLLVATYVADADRELLIQLHLWNIAGNGNYKACTAKQLIGAGTPTQTATAVIPVAAGTDTCQFETLCTAVKTLDVINIYVQGLVGDTSVDVATEVFDVTAAALDEVAEGAYTARDLLRLMASTLIGKLSGGGTTTVTFRSLGDGTDRIVTTVDANGNRTGVVLDPTDDP